MEFSHLPIILENHKEERIVHALERHLSSTSGWAMGQSNWMGLLKKVDLLGLVATRNQAARAGKADSLEGNKTENQEWLKEQFF